MVIVKTISVTEFKSHCFELLNEVARTGEPLALTRRGKPMAMVVPPPANVGKRWKLGQFRAHAKIARDIVVPLDESWEALRPSC